ncbi:MAG: universal stress protein [Duodenibacillus sp.]|nr:universal stress protein [Duodenibacillus sp.]
MKILLPIDGSRYSDMAVSFLASIASNLGEKPQVRVIVVVPAVPQRAILVTDTDQVHTYYEDEAQPLLTSAYERLSAVGYDVQTVYSIGSPGHHICHEAESFDADLIVMGSQGKSDLSGLFLGSVTREVLSGTKVPILVLRTSPRIEHSPIRIGIALDGSEQGIAASAYALSNRKMFGKCLFYLIHVSPEIRKVIMPMGMPQLEENEIKKQRMKEFACATKGVRSLFDDYNVVPRTVPLTGTPGEAIADFAAEEKLDLLILGSHGDGRFKAPFTGSTANHLVSHTDIPLLVIRV